MLGKPGDEARLQHMLDAILKIEVYLDKKSLDDFINISMLRFACVKQVEIIGEAAIRVSIKTRNQFSQINRKEIVAMRHVLVHDYFGIDFNVVWEVIHNDLPMLKTNLIQALKIK